MQCSNCVCFSHNTCRRSNGTYHFVLLIFHYSVLKLSYFFKIVCFNQIACFSIFAATDKTFDCPICKASFPKITPLKAHIHQHRSNGVYKCPHCPKEYEQYTLIRKHIRSFHSEPKLVCSVCNKAFRTPDKLRLHSLRHSDHREFLCSQCGRQFKRKDKLKAHMDHVHSAAACEKSKGRFIKTASKPANGAKKFAPKLVVSIFFCFIE